MKTLLILGGTTEARELADKLCRSYYGRARIITSLAGVVQPASPPPGELRVGPFNGSQDLSDYLNAEQVAMLIDATHPFATEISAQASQAATRNEIPKLQVLRPEWKQPANSKWADFPDLQTLAAKLPTFASRALLTVGSRGPKAFEGIEGVHCVIRLIEAPETPFDIPSHELLIERPPFDIAHETELLKRFAIDTVVTKNAGGHATAAKLYAAKDLGLKVACVKRPPAEPGDRASSVAEAEAWVQSRF